MIQNLTYINENETNTSSNNTVQSVKPNIGTFSVKDITDDERMDGVIGWINILENNKFEIPRPWWNV